MDENMHTNGWTIEVDFQFSFLFHFIIIFTIIRSSFSLIFLFNMKELVFLKLIISVIQQKFCLSLRFLFFSPSLPFPKEKDQHNCHYLISLFQVLLLFCNLFIGSLSQEETGNQCTVGEGLMPSEWSVAKISAPLGPYFGNVTSSTYFSNTLL